MLCLTCNDYNNICILRHKMAWNLVFFWMYFATRLIQREELWSYGAMEYGHFIWHSSWVWHSNSGHAESKIIKKLIKCNDPFPMANVEWWKESLSFLDFFGMLKTMIIISRFPCNKIRSFLDDKHEFSTGVGIFNQISVEIAAGWQSLSIISRSILVAVRPACKKQVMLEIANCSCRFERSLSNTRLVENWMKFSYVS